MLPLSQDYAKLARNSIGTEAERFEGFADDIASKSYVVQVLVQ